VKTSQRVINLYDIPMYKTLIYTRHINSRNYKKEYEANCWGAVMYVLHKTYSTHLTSAPPGNLISKQWSTSNSVLF